jgi:hypothetical protein
MIEIPKIISRFFEMFNPQKEMDSQTAIIIKADVSKKVREELLGETTRAKIRYGYVNQGILLLAILLGIFWTIIYCIRLQIL